MRSRVFVGPGNIAGNAMHIADCLKKTGIYAVSYSYLKHPFGYETDNNGLFLTPKKNRSLLKKIYFNRFTIRFVNFFVRIKTFFSALFRFNTFIFISTDTIFRNNADLRILKAFQKKIAFFFVGCPERDPSAEISRIKGSACDICNDTGKQNYCLCTRPERKKKRIRFLEKYADAIFTGKDTTGYLLEPSKQHIVRLVAEPGAAQDPLSKFNDLSVIRIAHFPSHKLFKGTDYVLKAVEELRSKYGNRIEFTHSRVSNREVKSILEKTHILLDQFKTAYGLLAVEGMANGCIVLNKIADWFRNEHPGYPNVDTDPHNIADTVSRLIENPAEMIGTAKKTIRYYREFHSPKAAGNYYKAVLDLK